MTDKLFDIVFRGDIVLGQPLNDVKVRIGKMFKLGPAQVEKLFSGKSVVLKRGLSEPDAAKFRDAFAKAGAVVSVVNSKMSGEGENASKERTRKLTVAPAGASLTPRRKEQTQSPPAMPNTDHLSIRPAEGDLLDEEEIAQQAPVAVRLSDWGIAEAGAVIETLPDDKEPVVVEDAHWQVAEAGSDLAEAKPDVPPVSAPEFAVAPVGSDMADPHEEVPLPAPDISHIKLADN